MTHTRLMAHVSAPDTVRTITVDLPYRSELLEATYNAKMKAVDVWGTTTDDPTIPAHSSQKTTHEIIFLRNGYTVPIGFRFLNTVIFGNPYNEAHILLFVYHRHKPEKFPLHYDGVFVPDVKEYKDEFGNTTHVEEVTPYTKDTHDRLVQRSMVAKERDICFAEGLLQPILLQAGDARVKINGRPIQRDFRIVSEGTYKALLKVWVDADHGVLGTYVPDELNKPPLTDKTVSQPGLKHGDVCVMGKDGLWHPYAVFNAGIDFTDETTVTTSYYVSGLGGNDVIRNAATYNYGMLDKDQTGKTDFKVDDGAGNWKEYTVHTNVDAIKLTNLSEPPGANEKTEPKPTQVFGEVSGYMWRGGVPDVLTPETEAELRKMANLPDQARVDALGRACGWVRQCLHTLDVEQAEYRRLRKQAEGLEKRVLEETEINNELAKRLDRAKESLKELTEIQETYRQMYDTIRSILSEQRQTINRLEDQVRVSEHAAQLMTDAAYSTNKIRTARPKILEGIARFIPGARVRTKRHPYMTGTVTTLHHNYAMVRFNDDAISTQTEFKDIEPEQA